MQENKNTMNEEKKWKNKKVVYFKWREYYGFVPRYTMKVIEETEKECLLGKWFIKIWTLKHRENVSLTVAQQCGYCKLINADQ